MTLLSSRWRCCLLCFCTIMTLVSFGVVSCPAAEDTTQFEQGVARLVHGNFRQKEVAIDKIATSNDPRAEQLLRTLLGGKLYRVKKDGTPVYVTGTGSRVATTAVLSDKALGTVKKRTLKKITINNKLRSKLRGELALIGLRSPNPDKRLASVNKLMSSLTPESTKILEKLIATETNSKVRQGLLTARAIVNLRDTDDTKRLQALTELQSNLNPVVKNELTRLLGEEKNKDVRQKAESVLSSIESKIAFYGMIEKIFFGLSLGSVLVLAAIGLAITFGVIGVINMAHGELIMLGAYTTYVIQQLMPNSISLALLLAIPAAFVISGLVGILIERTVIRFLYGRPLETLLATFGISLILQQSVRTIFSPLNRSVSTPAWMSGSLQLNPVLSLTINRLTILIFALLVFAGLYMLLKKSSLGLQVRAGAQNRSMARAMGIRAAKVDALTFGLGSGIAGIAGVALSQLTNVGPNLGQAYIIDSFMVVVFGGVGNLWGTLVGGLTLGVANKFLEPWTGAVLAKILILVFIILFIQKRPQGLFPQKGRAGAAS